MEFSKIKFQMNNGAMRFKNAHINSERSKKKLITTIMAKDKKKILSVEVKIHQEMQTLMK